MNKKKKILVELSINLKDGNCAKRDSGRVKLQANKEQRGIGRIAA
jgi:hypothetical protein